MSATDELRRMLDERGVHWWTGEDERKTLWESSGLTWEYFNNENGDAWLGFLSACEQDIAPEQAIAATLGKLPYDELLRCLENDWHISASWDGLRKFWNIELTEDGVQMRDSAWAERTCRDVSDEWRGFAGATTAFCCSECGAHYVDGESYYAGLADASDEWIKTNYCPNCGAKVVSE